MSIIEAIIIGIVQGLTEFLPISSSGHLVILQKLLKIDLPGNLVEVSTHLGTLLSIILIYKNDIYDLISSFKSSKTKDYILLVVIATIPSVVFVLIAKSFILTIFESSRSVSFALIFTGIILFISHYGNYTIKKLNISKGMIIGIFQALAILPGISRSGMTISIALLLGIKNVEAAKFSFMLAIPAIFGAAILTLVETDLNEIDDLIFPLIVAAFIAFLSGYYALKFLIKILNNGKFYYFSIYCIFLGIISLMYL
ncbi:MAG: hypothetical protein CMG58_06320 [Candidatus Marinimicrobia bacterium]|nr:hypothetical protein [Candidatus Neomarinimicrobiota bacterium]